jgi:hypothetical protein
MIRRAALWWVALYALWWLFVGSWSGWDAVWGAGLATLATVAALAAGGNRRVRGALGDGWPSELGAALLQVFPDFLVLVRVLARAVASGDRGPRGRFVTRDTTLTGRGAAPRRAWVTGAATLSPNAFVLDIDDETGRGLVHDLHVWRRSEEPL